MKLQAEIEDELNIAEKKDTKIYHPAHNAETGGALPTIFLTQMAYWWKEMKCKPFYKFVEPCEHFLYKPGQSWTEELGIGASTLSNYFKKLGRKLTSKEQNNWRKILAENEHLYFVYWTRRSDNLTYWAFNDEAYFKMRLRAYKLSPNLDLGSTNSNLGSTNSNLGNAILDLGNANLDLLNPEVSLPNNIDYSKTTQRLNKDHTKREEAQSNIDINVNSLSSFSDISQMSREQLLAEIGNLPNRDSYEAISFSCGWDFLLISAKNLLGSTKYCNDYVNHISQIRWANSLGDNPGIGKP